MKNKRVLLLTLINIFIAVPLLVISFICYCHYPKEAVTITTSTVATISLLALTLLVSWRHYIEEDTETEAILLFTAARLILLAMYTISTYYNGSMAFIEILSRS